MGKSFKGFTGQPIATFRAVESSFDSIFGIDEPSPASRFFLGERPSVLAPVGFDEAGTLTTPSFSFDAPSALSRPADEMGNPGFEIGIIAPTDDAGQPRVRDRHHRADVRRCRSCRQRACQ